VQRTGTGFGRDEREQAEAESADDRLRLPRNLARRRTPTIAARSNREPYQPKMPPLAPMRRASLMGIRIHSRKLSNISHASESVQHRTKKHGLVGPCKNRHQQALKVTFNARNVVNVT
jgi:hypothetical protein